MQSTFHCLTCGGDVPAEQLRGHLEYHQVTTAELENLLTAIRAQTITDVTTATSRSRDAAAELEAAVSSARAAGASWTDIGKAAGITRQSARERWSR